MKGLIKLTMISLGLVCASLSSKAQQNFASFGYFEDALRYSQAYNFGTARSAGLAGAGMALGGDIGTIANNPAGLGLFNRSQFVFTPTISLNKTDSRFLDGNTPVEESALDIGNVGIVINFGNGKLNPSGWSNGTLAVTYNRVNDFRRNTLFRGVNENNSIIDAMLQQADGLFPDQLTGIAQFGYDHYLINPLPDAQDSYDSFVLGFPEQVEDIRTTGYTDEVKVAYGTNYNDKIYLGAGIGLLTSEYNYSRVFTEFFNDPAINSLSIDERLEVNGTGVNLNAGIIFRPTNFVRLGLSYTSPTWYQFNEESDILYNTEFNDFDVSTWTPNGQRIIEEDTVLSSQSSGTDIFVSQYDLRTPSKVNAGVAFFFKKYGFITLDVEHLNYRNANITSLDFQAAGDNNLIKSTYRSVTNIKLGGEFRYEFLRLRAGFATIGDPFADGFDELDRSREITSVGVGLNFGKYFIDISHSNTRFDESFSSYSLEGNGGLPANPVAITETNLASTRITFGLNF